MQLRCLDAARPALDQSDYGLALALAGHPAEAIAVLEPAAREPERRRDAFVRTWRWPMPSPAIGTMPAPIAAQDVPAGQLDTRIQQWMQLASPKTPADQVAALIGVTPAAIDAGQPVRLALNQDRHAVRGSSGSSRCSQGRLRRPPAPRAGGRCHRAGCDSGSGRCRIRAAGSAAGCAPRSADSCRNRRVGSQGGVRRGHAAQRCSGCQAESRASRVAAAPRRGNSPAVVQLGAYGSPDRVLAAWNGTARKYGALKAYMPMSAKFASPKGVFYRLSVRGFASDAEARNLCVALKRKGGSCFVRNVAGDAPVNIAMR